MTSPLRIALLVDQRRRPGGTPAETAVRGFPADALAADHRVRVVASDPAASVPLVDDDALVITDPALADEAAPMVPAGVAAVVRADRVGPALSTAAAARMDGIAAPGAAASAAVEGALGPAAPPVAAIPDAAPTEWCPRSSLDTPLVVVPELPDAGELGRERAVRAFARAARSRPDWRLRVLGRPSEALNSLIDESDLHGRVEFAPAGAPGDTERSRSWSGTAVCLPPCGAESTGALLALLAEAFAAGVPVAAYDHPDGVGGPSEVVRHGTDGLLAPFGDLDAMETALGAIMDDRALRARMGRAAAQGLDRFHARRAARQWEEFLARSARASPRARVEARAGRRNALRGAEGAPSGGAEAGAGPVPAAGPNGERIRAEEERLLAGGAGRVRDRGVVAEVRDDLLPDDALRAGLDLVADALEEAGVPYALIRHDGTRHRLMVADDRRDRAVAALSAAGRGVPAYAEPLRPRAPMPRRLPLGLLGDLVSEPAGGAEAMGSTEATGTAEPTGAPGPAEEQEAREARETRFAAEGVRVYRPVTTSGRTLAYGTDFATDVEFWEREPDSGDLVGPFPTAAGDRLPEEAQVPVAASATGRPVPTFEPWGRTGLDDVDFPIDAVVTWVDGSDPAWQNRRDAALRQDTHTRSADSTDPNRFTDSGELRYALRAIAMHAPWINRIHLVTDDQVPDWLDTAHPRIRVVDHRDIFPDTAHLPTFNSRAIGTRLHHVPDLAEHFLCFNDDIFLGRRLRPVQFFLPSGTAKFFRSPVVIPFSAPTAQEKAYFAAKKRNRGLIERDFGRTPVHGFLHAPHALRRSVLQDVEKRYPDPIARTTANRFRSPDDVCVPGSLDHDLAYLTGRAVPARLRTEYVDVGDPDQHPKLDRLLDRRAHDVFCVTDSLPEQVPGGEQSRMIGAFLRAYFPVPAPWEHTAHGPRESTGGAAAAVVSASAE